MTTTKPRTPARTLVSYAPVLVLLLLAGAGVEEGLRLLLTVDAAAQADMAGWYVLVLGVVLAVTTCCAERPSVTVTVDEEPADDGTARPARPRHDVLVCLLLVAVYALLLGTLGHVVAGVAVVFVFLRGISRYGWWRSTLYTVAINAVFVTLFELTGVVLPTGILTF